MGAEAVAAAGRGDSRRPVRRVRPLSVAEFMPRGTRGALFPAESGRVCLSAAAAAGGVSARETSAGEVDGVAGAGATGLISGLGHTNARCGG